jgi:hypothetical protein
MRRKLILFESFKCGSWNIINLYIYIYKPYFGIYYFVYVLTFMLYNFEYTYTDDRLCGLVVRVPGYTTEKYCASCEVRTEFIYVMLDKVDCLCGLVVRVLGYRSGGPGSIPDTN